MARDTDLMHLHPIVREKIHELNHQLDNDSLPFKMFEGFRSAQRQQELYAQGRTKPGNKVTNAPAWSSYHQYGIAADFVLYEDGNWSWKDSGKYQNYWKKLHQLARSVGLEPLSWETPHLQLQGVSLAQLRQGRYPDGGDESWVENLYREISQWRAHPKPPAPSLSFGRPPLPSEAPTVTRVAETATTAPLQYQVAARNGLRMRAGPAVSFDIITTLASGQIVTVAEKSAEWYQVDLEGDGLVDGYCHSGYLKPV